MAACPPSLKLRRAMEGKEMEFGEFVELVSRGKYCHNGKHGLVLAREIALEHSLMTNRVIEFLMEIGVRCDCQIICLSLENEYLSEQWKLCTQGVSRRINGRGFVVWFRREDEFPKEFAPNSFPFLLRLGSKEA